MSDSDGYSASSGYLYFSEKSGTPVERKTVKSDTFTAIVELDVFTPVDQLFAKLSISRKTRAVLVAISTTRPQKTSDSAMEMLNGITVCSTILRRQRRKSVESAHFSV